MPSALYSSNAPLGWNQLDPATKQKFYDIASKGDWSAHEAYDHLVPDTLKDNPDEVIAWMDGNPDIGIPDRDVSRIESGENGGEYSTDNTVMENSSANRSRGADNMTGEEQLEVARDNQADIETIEAHYQGDAEVVEAVPVTDDGGVLEVLGDVAEVILPAVITGKVATNVWRNTRGTTADKLAMSTAVGAPTFVLTSMLLANPLVQAGLAISAGIKITKWVANKLK